MLSLPLTETTAASGALQPVVEDNLKPREDGRGIEFAKDSLLEFPDAAEIVNPASGTISMEIEPAWAADDRGDNSFLQIRSPEMWNGRMSLWRNGKYLIFGWIDDTGIEHGVGTDIGSWAQGERHTVAATWGDALMSLYVDGILANQATYDSDPAIAPGMPLYVGSNPQNRVAGANSTLQNLRIYDRPLSAEEIAQQPLGDPSAGR